MSGMVYILFDRARRVVGVYSTRAEAEIFALNGWRISVYIVDGPPFDWED